MKSLKIAHFFDVIKKEVQSEDEREIPSKINELNVKQEYLYKEELDLPWDGEDHSNGIVEDNCGSLNISSYKLGCPVVLLERLPDNLANNAVNERFFTARYKNEPQNLDANDSDRKSFLQYYWKFCPDCNKKEPSKSKTQKCKICDSRWRYECRKCSKKLSSYGGIINHVNTQCIEQGNYYKCFKCNYKSIDKYKVNAHLKKVHLTFDSQSRIEKFRSENVQNDVVDTAKLHKCSKCGKQFQKLPQLLRHIQTCGQTKYNSDSFVATINAAQDKYFHHCVKCNKTVKNDEGGSFHQKKCSNCHSKSSFKCKKCDKIFHSYNGMNQHFKISHTVTKDVFKCPECDYETPFMHYLSKHVRRTHFLETHECSKCGQKYKNRNAFKSHSLYCKKEPQFQCDHCLHKTKTKMRLKNHILLVHTKGNRVECSQCGATTKNEFYLKIHLKYCQVEPHHECNMCHFKTKFKHDLTNHYKYVHAKNQKKESCIYCAKECKNKSSLRSHLRYCGKFPNLSCNYCSQVFKYKTTLTLHINRKHQENDDRDNTHNLPYLQCNDCTYKTKFKGDLVKHVITHLEDNIKECPVCKKHFKTEYFKRHANYCGRDPLQCHLCNYQTFTKECMKKHISNIHSKGNEIDCSRCDRTCRNKSYLRSHMQRCGTEPHLQCDHCSYKTKYKYTLKKHIEKSHMQ